MELSRWEYWSGLPCTPPGDSSWPRDRTWLSGIGKWILYCLSHQGNSILALLLLPLSRFSSVLLCATPKTAAHQASPSLGLSRQEHWSGLPFPSPMHESEVVQSCLTPSGPMDCSLPGSSIHGIFQARVLEWVAIALYRYKIKFKASTYNNI